MLAEKGTMMDKLSALAHVHGWVAVEMSARGWAWELEDRDLRLAVSDALAVDGVGVSLISCCAGPRSAGCRWNSSPR